jgi:hypothetical protein|nr:hypothetical protein [Candidatus Krumholzibacteria bacterium]
MMILDRGPRLGQTLVLTLGLAMFLSGCLFEPRDDEPPSLGAQVTYNPRNSPRNVWENLQISLQNNDSFGWEENISPDFTYEPDSESVPADNPGFFQGWNFEREKAFINNFYTSPVTSQAQMRNDEFIVPEASGVEVIWTEVIYFVRVTNTNDNSEIRYRGSANITFKLEGNFWYVYRWVDLIGENDPDTGQPLPTLGVLRGTFGSN